MALTRIISFAGPPFVPLVIETNQHFIIRYKQEKFSLLASHRQFQSLDFVSGLGPDLPYTVALNLSALGTTQGTALGLSSQDNEIKNSTAGTQLGVRITLVTPGVPTTVHNYSPNDISV